MFRLFSLWTLGVLFTFITNAFAKAQQRIDGVLQFDKSTYDFGKIKKGKPVTCDFLFTNISDKPVVITQVQTSCGCTQPHYPQKPIMANEKDKINVGYDAALPGVFRKTIFVQIAGVPELKELIIQGEVVN